MPPALAVILALALGLAPLTLFSGCAGPPEPRTLTLGEPAGGTFSASQNQFPHAYRLVTGPGVYHLEFDGSQPCTISIPERGWSSGTTLDWLEPDAGRHRILAVDLLLPGECSIEVEVPPDQEVTYTLTVTPSDILDTDRDEPNDTREQAARQGWFAAGAVMGSDQDWFRFSVTTPGVHSVRLVGEARAHFELYSGTEETPLEPLPAPLPDPDRVWELGPMRPTSEWDGLPSDKLEALSAADTTFRHYLLPRGTYHLWVRPRDRGGVTVAGYRYEVSGRPSPSRLG